MFRRHAGRKHLGDGRDRDVVNLRRQRWARTVAATLASAIVTTSSFAAAAIANAATDLTITSGI